jgi:hypothetical protein
MGDEYEQPISVSVVVVLDDNTVAITEARQGTLYKEKPGMGYDQCVRLDGLDDPSGAMTSAGHIALREWVEKNAELVIIHSANPASLNLGTTGLVGLTSTLFGTGTKTRRALTDNPLKPLTVADLRLAGLIP